MSDSITPLVFLFCSMVIGVISMMFVWCICHSKAVLQFKEIKYDYYKKDFIEKYTR